MPRFLILKLDGPMQAWGTHTYEDFRPSNLFPTRSGLLGLIGACLGVRRDDGVTLERLATGLEFTVRSDREAHRPEASEPGTVRRVPLKFTDYHTVIEARRANRAPKEGETIQTWREYLYDASFTVAIGIRPNADADLDAIAAALIRPVFTPCLGRRSCPLGRPLRYERNNGFVEAGDALAAMSQVAPLGGVIYAESDGLVGDPRMRLRDVPMNGRIRRFNARTVSINTSGKKI